MTIDQLCKKLSKEQGVYVHATEQPHRLYIDNIQISPEYQSKGLGTKVMRLLIQWAYEHNIVCVECKPVPDEGREQDLATWYMQFGFQPRYERNKHTGRVWLNPSNATHMGTVRLDFKNKIKSGSWWKKV